MRSVEGSSRPAVEVGASRPRPRRGSMLIRHHNQQCHQSLDAELNASPMLLSVDSATPNALYGDWNQLAKTTKS